MCEQIYELNLTSSVLPLLSCCYRHGEGIYLTMPEAHEETRHVESGELWLKAVFKKVQFFPRKDSSNITFDIKSDYDETTLSSCSWSRRTSTIITVSESSESENSFNNAAVSSPQRCPLAHSSDNVLGESSLSTSTLSLSPTNPKPLSKYPSESVIGSPSPSTRPVQKSSSLKKSSSWRKNLRPKIFKR